MENTWMLRGHNNNDEVIFFSPRDDPNRYRIGERKGRQWETSLGSIFLASWLEQFGWEFEPAKKIEIEVNGLSKICRGAFVGISVLPSNYKTALEIAKTVKEGGAKKVILGGPYINTRAEQIVARHSFVDYAVRGAGEVPLLKTLATPDEISEAVVSRNRSSQKKRVSSSYLLSSARPVPNRSLWPNQEGAKGTVVYWQDGCPYAERCIFCTIQHTGFSRRSILQVITEMRQLQNMGIVEIEDGGDDFVAGPEIETWLEGLARYMKEEGLKFEWLIHASTHSLLSSPQIVELLYRVGVRTIQVGFESEEFKLAFKTTHEEEEILTGKVKDFGMKIYGAWILGMPGETENSAQRTIERILQMHREGVLGGLMVDPLWPGPGSAAFEMLCANHPIWRESDYVEPEELMNAWFAEYTKVSLEKALALRQSVLDEIEDKVEIVGGMLL